MIETVEIEEIEVIEPAYVPEELLPPANDPEGVGTAIIKMLDEILAYRDDQKLAERCTRFYQLRRAKHWKHKNPSLKLVSANLLGSHHQKTVNMLTDNNPTFNAVPAGDLGPDGEDKLTLLTKMIDSWWIETEQQHVLEETVHVGELYGTVGEMLSFNVNTNFPVGEVEAETLDPLYFSLYPPKCRTVEKAEAVLRWYPLSVREARRKWPQVADQIVSDTTLLSEIGDDRQDETAMKASRRQIVIDTVRRWLSGDTQATDDDCDETYIIEAWVKDYSTDQTGNPVYPGNIRRVRVANGGGVVLDDAHNPSIHPDMPDELKQRNYLYSRFPFSYTHSTTDPASPFGFSDFEQLEQLNMEFNKTMSQFTVFKDKASRVKLINPQDTGVTNEELDNSPGIVNPINSLVSQAIRYMDPPNMGSDIPTALTLYKDIFNEIAGSFNDVTQGQKSGSEVIAAKAIAMLLEEASRMARGKIRNYSKMLRERGRMYIALAQSWYDVPRYVMFQPTGKEAHAVPVDRGVLQIPGQINVVTGSTMPISRIQEREESLTLFKMGVIDQEELLKKIAWNNWRDVVTRMQQGPLGQYLGKLGMIGVPKPLLQMFQQLGKMDEKEIERGLKEGKIPPFQAVIQQMMGQQQPQQPDPEMVKAQLEGQKLQIETQKAQADMREKQARIDLDMRKAEIEAAKVQAEIELIKQKIETEIVERQVKAFGVELDKENIRIEKAKAVASIQATRQGQKMDKVRTTADIIRQKEDMAGVREDRAMKMREDKGGYDERGMGSNNESL